MGWEVDWSGDWANTPPVADAGPDQIINAGIELTFDGSGSYDTDGTIVSWEWDFGDTTSDSGEIVTKTYNTDDVYTVTLTVTDNNGATDTDTCIVTITKPTISGIVKSQSNIPMQYATITINGNEDITDENGSYSIDILPGTYDVTIEYALFKTIEQSIEITGDMTQNFELYKVEIARTQGKGASLEGGTGCGTKRNRKKYVNQGMNDR